MYEDGIHPRYIRFETKLGLRPHQIKLIDNLRKRVLKIIAHKAAINNISEGKGV